MGPAFLRKYNTAITAGTAQSIKIPVVKRGVVDFAVGADWTPAAGDVKVSKDGGAAANIATLPAAVAMGNTAYWEFVFSGAELSCGTLAVTIADSATKAVEDQAFLIETFGNASAFYPMDFSDVVRMGLTALPNAAAEAAGGLYTRGAGAGQIKQTNNGEIDSNCTHVNNVATTSVTTINANVGTTQPVNYTGTGASALVKSDAIDINSVACSSVTTINANIGTTQPVNFTGTAGSALVKGDAIDINSVACSSVTTVNANIGTTQPVNFTGAAGSALVKSDAVDIAGVVPGSATIGTVTTVTNRVTANTDQLAGQTVTAAAGVTFPSSVASPTNITAATGVALTSSYDFAKGTVAVTESYNTDGSAPTPVQALMGILQTLTEFSISGTTLTVKKLDGSTTAMTLTLDSSSAPTAVTRTG